MKLNKICVYFYLDQRNSDKVFKYPRRVQMDILRKLRSGHSSAGGVQSYRVQVLVLQSIIEQGRAFSSASALHCVREMNGSYIMLMIYRVYKL